MRWAVMYCKIGHPISFLNSRITYWAFKCKISARSAIAIGSVRCAEIYAIMLAIYGLLDDAQMREKAVDYQCAAGEQTAPAG